MLNNQTINKILNKRKSRVLVIGDLMLDEYVFGDVKRVSPEAPVPIVNFSFSAYQAGGAGNVAMNIADLGSEVMLAGAVGRDSQGRQLADILRRKGVKTKGIVFSDAPTIHKTRVMAQQHQLFRLDREVVVNDRRIGNFLWAFAKKTLPLVDVLVISDYGKGAVNRPLARKIITLANRLKKPIIVDCKPANLDFYKNASVIAPNLKEAAEMTGGKLKDVAAMGKLLVKKINGNVLITQGEQGMTLFNADGSRRYYPPFSPKKLFDVIGAGDTVIAALAHSLAKGLDLTDASFLANRAGGIVVGKLGTATISTKELLDSFWPQLAKVKNLNQAAAVAKDFRRRGHKVVLASGCFDILHSGHIELFQAAKQLGDILIVGVNSDSSIKKIKGPERPFLKQKRRLFNLASLTDIDYIVSFNEATPENLIKKIKPDIFVKGSDWRGKKLPESGIIKSYGGQIVFMPLLVKTSTTDIAKTL